MRKWIIIGVSVVAVILLVYTVCAYLFPEFRVATRDIAITLVAVTGLIAAIALVAILFAVLYAVNKIRSVTNDTVLPKVQVLQEKVDQILERVTSIADQARSSATTVRETTEQVSTQVVTPVIRLAGLAAGVRAGAAFIARRGAPRGDA